VSEISDVLVPAGGSENPCFYFVGSSPTKTEEREGRPFISEDAQRLRGFIDYVGIPAKDCRFHNVVPYHTPYNRAPTKAELKAYYPQLVEDLKATRPKVVVVCGNSPLKAFLSDLEKTPTISNWHGRSVPYTLDDETRFWLCPLWAPDYLSKMLKSKSMGTEYGRAYLHALGAVETLQHKELPPPYDLQKAEDDIVQLFEVNEIISALEKLKETSHMAMDLETDGLSPYEAECQLPLTAALTTKECTITFPISHPERAFTEEEQLRIFGAFLEAMEGALVIGQNINFDINWLLACATDVEKEKLASVQWHDTMAQAHFLDERHGSGIQSMDALCMLRFGIPGKAHAGVDKSRLKYEPLRKVLRYNGMDTYFTLDLFLNQVQLLKEKGQLDGYVNHAERLFPLSAMMSRGVPVEGKEVLNQIENLMEEERTTLKRIKEHEDVKERMPNLNPNSPQQLLTLFKGFGFSMKDEKGKETTNEAMLSSIKHPLAKAILDLRGVRGSISMLKNYQSGDEHGWYLVHPNFLHTSTTTGRTSCRGPNLQNLNSSGPMRRIVAAPPGYVLIDVDYKQLEACIIASCSQDEFFLEALKNDLDVHRRWALWFAERKPSLVGGRKNLNNEEAIAKFRKAVKNLWVFPAFYNASLYALQRYMGVSEQLATEAYELFWKEFAGVRRWQQHLIKMYKEKGYVESPTFRRRHAPLKPAEIVNSPIQGSASDIVVKAMEGMVNAGWVPVANIHDELLFCVEKEKAQALLADMQEIMLERFFDWLITPLTINVKAGKRWAKSELTDLGEFKGAWS